MSCHAPLWQHASARHHLKSQVKNHRIGGICLWLRTKIPTPSLILRLQTRGLCSLTRKMLMNEWNCCTNFRIKRQQQKNMLDRKNSNNKKSKNGQAKIMRHHQSPETSDAQVGIPFAFCLYTYISTIYRQIYVRYFSVYVSRCLLFIFFFSCCIWRSLVERWKRSADVFSISLYLYWQARKFSNFARRKLPHT